MITVTITFLLRTSTLSFDNIYFKVNSSFGFVPCYGDVGMDAFYLRIRFVRESGISD